MSLRLGIEAHILDPPGRERVGVGRYAIEIVKGLARVRPDWDLRVLTNRIDLFQGLDLDVRSTKWPTTTGLGRVTWIHAESALERSTKGLDAWFGTAFTLPQWWRGPSVVCIHDLGFTLMPDRYAGRLRARYATVATRSAARRADAIVCGAEQTRQALADVWNVPREKVHVTSYGVADVFLPRGEPRRVEPPFVLFVGTFEARKGLDTLAEALHRLDGVNVVLAGRPGWGVADTVPALTADPRVELRTDPTDEQLADLYRTATALVYPSRAEGFGLPVAEAMASGCPVVASELGCIREFADDVPLYFTPGDADGLARQLRRMLTDAGLREERAATGTRLGATLTWDVVASRTAAAIETAVERPG
jgi:glycosyltransferase involved in cell wall biosynthesis